MSNDVVSVVFALDSGFVAPTLTAVYSVLKNTKSPVHIHIMGFQFSDEDWTKFQRIVDHFGEKGELIRHPLSPDALNLPKHLKAHITSASFLRLYVPDFIEGRVIYIDGDVLVRRDLSEFFNAPLDGKLVGVVPNTTYLKLQYAFDKQARGETLSKDEEEVIAKNPEKLRVARDVVEIERIDTFFNCGVLLIDCDAFRAREDFLRAWQDKDLIVEQGMSCDQIWSNCHLKNDLKVLPLKYNANWPTSKPYKSFAPENTWDDWQEAKDNPVIFHFTGGKKPWLPLKKCFSWHSRKYVFQFRRYMREVAKILSA